MATIDLRDLISQAEAARLRRVTREAIYDLVSRGRLNAIEIGGTKFVRRSQVLAFKERRAGRPTKTAKTPYIESAKPNAPRASTVASSNVEAKHKRKR